MKKLSVLILLALLSLSFLANISFAGNAPYFSVKDINGSWVDSGDLFGNYIVFIMFWSTDCQACKDSMHYLQQLYDK